ncbi:MAG: hypothetical protein QOK37_2024 [Thermoanaerobaculia bacterium]|jgi:hypothetical protein|nr:hypothetical protein [Thermoanaerobaculia bacterium]
MTGAHPTRFSNLTIERLVLAASCALATLILIPWQPRIFNWDIDLSWQLVLHEAFANGLAFGRQVAFTFGPWGFAYSGYDPRTFAATLAAGIVTAAALTLASAEISRRTIVNPWRRAAFIVIVAALVAIDDGFSPDARYVLLAFALVLIQTSDGRRAAALFLAAVLGLVALIKFSFFIAAIVAVGATVLDDLLKRRLPAAGATFVASLAAFWLLARQPLSLFPAYVRIAWEIASSYSEAMAVASSAFADHVILVAFIVIAAVCVWGSCTGATMTPPSRLISAGSMAAIFFLTFKAGFVRHDRHELIATTTLACVALLAAPGRRRMMIPLVAALALLAASRVTSELPPLAQSMRLSVEMGVRRFVHFTRYGTSDLDRLRQSTRDMYARYLTSRPAGTTFDVYPSSSALLWAFDLPARRRPVFQSYCVETPLLDELNASHLRGSEAPSTILFDVRALEGRLASAEAGERFPSLDDGSSWPELLARYRPAGFNGEFLVLDRRSGTHPPRLDLLLREEIRIGQTVRLNEAGPLFVRLDVRPRFRERLQTLLLRAGTPPNLVITTTDSRRRSFSFVPKGARAGFLLSPLIRTKEDFASLYAASATLPRVTSITIADAPSSRFAETVSIEIYRLRFD